jgi:hypothetical protein
VNNFAGRNCLEGLNIGYLFLHWARFITPGQGRKTNKGRIVVWAKCQIYSAAIQNIRYMDLSRYSNIRYMVRGDVNSMTRLRPEPQRAEMSATLGVSEKDY